MDLSKGLDRPLTILFFLSCQINVFNYQLLVVISQHLGTVNPYLALKHIFGKKNSSDF